jgi:hypothetical protein
MNMSEVIDAPTFNQMFLDRSAEAGGLQKAAAAETDIVRQKIWEDGFARRLFPPKDVDRNDPHIQEDMKTDTIYYLEHVETLGYAMTCNIRGNGVTEVFYSKKFPIAFHKIETMHLATDEYTIKAMPYPFVKDIEAKFPLFMQMVEDREMVLHFEAMVQTIQKWDNGAVTKLCTSNLDNVKETAIRKSELARIEDTDNFTIHVPQRSDFAYLSRLFPGYKGESMRGETILMTETDFAGFNTWQIDDVGGDLAGKITVDGYTAHQVLGYKFIRTIKTSILRPGNIYMIAGPGFGGKFLRFIDTTVVMERYGDRMESWAWEVIGMGFANMRFIKKLELYSASVTPGFKDAGYEDVEPMSEEQIIKDNAFPERSDGYVPVIMY